MQLQRTRSTFDSRRQSLQQLVAPLVDGAARTVARTAEVTRLATAMLATFSSGPVLAERPATQTATATARGPRDGSGDVEDVDDGTQDGASLLAGPAREGALVAAGCPPKDSKRSNNRYVPADTSAPTSRKRNRKKAVAEAPPKRVRAAKPKAKAPPKPKAQGAKARAAK
mmetsp:Transcript_2594/g.7612  ORF Transcript_2594/g.7612 Transcript_2594/m.7612 type:complete len:170 (+) Transcript_2594:1-510(+)